MGLTDTRLDRIEAAVLGFDSSSSGGGGGGGCSIASIGRLCVCNVGLQKVTRITGGRSGKSDRGIRQQVAC
jgi:hypothetical protein